MGGYKDIQTEAEEKAADPVFRVAVLLILNEMLDKFIERREDVT
tara:strand:- start:999 stop:1130 length:132 start_codon:yes stop_codon:yes gene_type:complete